MGHGAEERNRALGIRCAMLAREGGLTHRQIAALVGKRPEQIKALIAMGDRVRGLPSSTTNKK